jgi:FtsH-binding integral membrane protein
MDKAFLDAMGRESLVRAQQDFLTKVYAWMVGGLLLTALSAWFVANDPVVLTTVIRYWLFFVIGEFALVIALSGWIQKMSRAMASLAFLGYSLLNGVTLSIILMSYTGETIASTFIITACMFAALSIFGFVTKKNLSGVGSFMFMGLIGIIIASVVNIFIGSSMIQFAISVIGVFVFAGLTAYDTQRLKEMYEVQFEGDEIAAKGAIIGALMLYLDFINLFLFLLRLFGRRN